jgi:pimeloyl-ACP methyl ester carboxylesterase
MSRRRAILIWSCAWLTGCASAVEHEREQTPVTVAPAVAISRGEPAMAQRHTVEVQGHPIATWSKQPASARDVLVLVHGRTWSTLPDFDLQVAGEQRSLMDAFVEQGFAVYGIDLRGYGATPRDDTGWLTPDRAVADVAAVLHWVAKRHPALPRPTLLGWSMGSLVAQLTAQQHPERLSAVVLYGYPRDPDAEHPAGPPAGSRPPRRETTAKAAAEDFITPQVVSQATIDAFVESALRSDPVKVDWRGTDQLAALDPAGIAVPTLLIHGERDPYAPVQAQAKLFSRLGHPDRTWVIVAGGDHAAHLEDTAPRFVQAVVSFVRRPRL